MTELKLYTNVRENVHVQDADVKPVIRDPMEDDRVLLSEEQK